MNFAYLVSRQVMNIQQPAVPGWTGFNTVMAELGIIPSKNVIEHLPIVDDSPTDMSTVFTVLNQSLDIAKAT
jgi:hypothetical protein